MQAILTHSNQTDTILQHQVSAQSPLSRFRHCLSSWEKFTVTPLALNRPQNKKQQFEQLFQCTTLILALGRQRRMKLCVFQASLVYLVSLVQTQQHMNSGLKHSKHRNQKITTWFWAHAQNVFHCPGRQKISLVSFFWYRWVIVIIWKMLSLLCYTIIFFHCFFFFSSGYRFNLCRFGCP